MTLGFSGAQTLDMQSNMPNMSKTFSGWQSKLSLLRTTITYIEGERVETTSEMQFLGVIQPMSSKQLITKPEGQRAWSWFTVHIENSDLNLDVDDKLKLGPNTYRIMDRWQWDLNGYREYHIIQIFE